MLQIARRDAGALRTLNSFMRELPPLDGLPVEVETRDEIHVRADRLVFGDPESHSVHAAANIRGRKILVEKALLDDPVNLKRIFIHELFHFVWVRMSNRSRRGFEDLLRRELDRGARGELGWSAELRKKDLRDADREQRSRKWREYVCESFCDTSAWWFAARDDHPEYTLAKRHCGARRAWCRNFLGGGRRIAL